MRISSAKDVCPRCGRHSEFATAKRRETWFHRFDAKNTPVTCLFCGATVRRCELRRYTPADTIQACANLAAAIGVDDMTPYLARCEERNRERGRYGEGEPK